MLTRKEQELLDALAPTAEKEGVDLVTLEVVGAKKAPTIRVYIDTDHGVSFDELAAAQAWSPGIDRPLRTREHFERFAGEKVVVKTTAPINGRGTYSGVLVGMNGDDIEVDCDGELFAIPFDAVKKANVKGTFDFN